VPTAFVQNGNNSAIMADFNPVPWLYKSTQFFCFRCSPHWLTHSQRQLTTLTLWLPKVQL